jgi:uncharacterized protein (DUF488 family)
VSTQGDVWTVGHWTCPEQTFIGLLHGQEIELLVDVRSAPGSRTSPHFNRDAMPEWLQRAGIGYRHLPDLGGRRPRRPGAGELNAGWRNASFRNYADYSLTAGYERGIAELEALARAQRVAYLCAEPMPWRCHRLLISNTLSARGWRVHHIIASAGPASTTSASGERGRRWAMTAGSPIRTTPAAERCATSRSRAWRRRTSSPVSTAGCG